MLNLSRLTPQQRQAATAPDGPLLIIAGPGSGKTTVLAARIAHLVIERRVPPAAILALTFTRTAAVHLRLRLAGMLRDRAGDVDISTFHSLGLRVVRLWSTDLGYTQDRLTVYRAVDQRRELERLAVQAGLKTAPAETEELIRATDALRLTGELIGPDHVGLLAQRYEALLQRRGAVDFTAMLALPLRLFAGRPDALRLQQDAYRHLLADEFQDVNGPQYDLLRLLVQPHRNLTAVGDPGQRIYSWRGASPAVLDAFRRDYPDARVLTLDDNFRSTQRVLAVGNSLGREATGGRQMRTTNAPGLTPVVYAAADEQDEARWLAGQVRRLLAGEQPLTPGEIAVVYRTHDQAPVLSAGLRAAGIRHVVRGPELEADEPAPTQDNRASILCTIHQTKGAEWRAVLLAGFEEGLLPHARALAGADQNQVLEEQRLAYVAISRAREQLFLSWCRTRTVSGTRVERQPSRFLRRLSGELLRTAA